MPPFRHIDDECMVQKLNRSQRQLKYAQRESDGSCSSSAWQREQRVLVEQPHCCSSRPLTMDSFAATILSDDDARRGHAEPCMSSWVPAMSPIGVADPLAASTRLYSVPRARGANRDLGSSSKSKVQTSRILPYYWGNRA